MTDKYKILKRLVIKEAKALKEQAKISELKKLDFSTFCPDNIHQCIYGQMTNVCTSKRAESLIKKCAERVYDFTKAKTIASCPLNGSPKDTVRTKQFGGYGFDLLYFSPIEKFIATGKNQKNGNNERLIKFLKGETKTLKLI